VLYCRLCECGECGCNYECQCYCCNMLHSDIKCELLFEINFGLSITQANKFPGFYE